MILCGKATRRRPCAALFVLHNFLCAKNTPKSKEKLRLFFAFWGGAAAQPFCNRSLLIKGLYIKPIPILDVSEWVNLLKGLSVFSEISKTKALWWLIFFFVSYTCKDKNDDCYNVR